MLNVTVTIANAGSPLSPGDRVVVKVEGASESDTSVIRQAVTQAIDAWQASHGAQAERMAELAATPMISVGPPPVGGSPADSEPEEWHDQMEADDAVRDTGIPLPRTEEGGELRDAGF